MFMTAPWPDAAARINLMARRSTPDAAPIAGTIKDDGASLP